MSNYRIFIGKEIVEIVRTKRFFVLTCVFLFFAFASPLLARYLTEFIVMMMPTEDAALVTPFMTEPVWQDGYIQFYSNISQVGLITVILLFMGVVLDEKKKDTAALMMMKGLSHTGFVMAKFTVMAAAAFVVVIISVLIAHLYTFILFGTAASAGDLMSGALINLLGIFFVLSFVIFCSTIAKSTAMSAILGFLVYMLIIIVEAIPRIGSFSPSVMLLTRPIGATTGVLHEHLPVNILITAALTAVFLVLSINILKKNEM